MKKITKAEFGVICVILASLTISITFIYWVIRLLMALVDKLG